MQEKEFVLITDGDIVFLKNNFMQYCIDNIEDKDILIQNDKRSNDNDEELCTGFMFIRSNERTKNLFNPKKLTKKFYNDQHYINYSRDRFTYKKLPLELFPNGGYYFEIYNKYNKDPKCLDPFLIHFNHIKGAKKDSCYESSKWLVSR